MSASPLNVEVSGLPFGDWAIRPPTRSLDAITRPVAPVYFRKSRRVGLIHLHGPAQAGHYDSQMQTAEHAEHAEKILALRPPRSLRLNVFLYTAGETDV